MDFEGGYMSERWVSVRLRGREIGGVVWGGV